MTNFIKKLALRVFWAVLMLPVIKLVGSSRKELCVLFAFATLILISKVHRSLNRLLKTKLNVLKSNCDARSVGKQEKPTTI